MGVWGDIRRRVNKDDVREEDRIPINIPDFITHQTVFVETLDSNSSITNHSAGKIYFVTENITLEGVNYKRGDTIIDTGKEFVLFDT